MDSNHDSRRPFGICNLQILKRPSLPKRTRKTPIGTASVQSGSESAGRGRQTAPNPGRECPLGYLTQIGDLRAALLDYFRKVVPSSAFQLVVTTLDQISSGAGGGKLSIGILGTLWAASNGMTALSH